MKIHVRKSKTYPMNLYPLCSHATKNKDGFVPLLCVEPKLFINEVESIDRCKHCEKALNVRRQRKQLPIINWN